jgi:hypothetical protein
MSLAGQITDYLNREGAATPETVASAIPELSQCGGAERALLLLRLNPQFERIDTASTTKSQESCDEFMVKEKSTPYLASSKWITRGSGKTDEDAVLESAQHYFKTIGRPGAPIANVVMKVSQSTGLDAPKVTQILLRQFKTMNTNIFNRPKRQEDK